METADHPFLSLSLPSREFSEADIIGFVTVLSANRPIILRCILLGIDLPFCFWVTAFDRFPGVLIAGTKSCHRHLDGSAPRLDRRPLAERDIPRNDRNGEMVSLLGELSTSGRNRKWVFFSPLLLGRVAREIKIEVTREARVLETGDKDRGREKEVWSERRSCLFGCFRVGRVWLADVAYVTILAISW